MIKNMTCVACPMGCQIKATIEDGVVTNVEGNSCKRGLEYAKTECTNPKRSITSTVRVNGGKMAVVPIKSAQAIPKELMFKCMEAINSVAVDAPVKIGDVIIKNVLDTGIDIVATNNVAKLN